MKQSLFEKSHPWVTFCYLSSVLVVTMVNRHPWFILLSFLASLIYAISVCGKAVWRRTLGCGLAISFFMVGIMPLFYHNGITPLYYINEMAVTAESLFYGFIMTLLLLAVLQWFFVWSERMGEDKILYLLGRGMPALALLITMSLRFVPLLRLRFREIREARQGLEGDMGHGPIRRASDSLRDFSVLVSWSLEESVETSVSMEARGYGIRRRTSFHLFRFRRQDAVCLLLLLLLAVIIGWELHSGMLQAQYFPETIYRRQGTGLWVSLWMHGILFTAPFLGNFFYSKYRLRVWQEQSEEALQRAEREYLAQWFGTRKEEDR